MIGSQAAWLSTLKGLIFDSLVSEVEKFNIQDFNNGCVYVSLNICLISVLKMKSISNTLLKTHMKLKSFLYVISYPYPILPYPYRVK